MELAPTLYHFDINGTIIGTDSTNIGETIHDAALEGLARSMTWLLNGDSALPHHETYYEHIKKYDTEGYKNRIANLLGNHPHLKPKYDLLCDAYKKGLFESFLHFLETTIVGKPDQVVIFRTFGHDGNQVLQLLKCDNRFEHLNTIILEDLTNIPSILNAKQHQLILYQDDYETWNNANRNPLFGKVIKSIDGWNQCGFDDNRCMVAEGNIETVRIFKVNTFEAAIDKFYFINLMST
uniref:Uncharacterized protein n=1 Tax=Clandestinovirus TaxID=2831644 RepID=A0A8F8KPB7_9VIRU|nr:hypothetical protein KOM_12_523 [Clandestinovirus]